MNTFTSGLKFGFLTGITNSICNSLGFGYGMYNPWGCGSFGGLSGFGFCGPSIFMPSYGGFSPHDMIPPYFGYDNYSYPSYGFDSFSSLSGGGLGNFYPSIQYEPIYLPNPFEYASYAKKKLKLNETIIPKKKKKKIVEVKEDELDVGTRVKKQTSKNESGSERSSTGVSTSTAYSSTSARTTQSAGIEKHIVQVPTEERFDNMLSFILKAEGGYNPDDCGQPGMNGVLQSTYDSYRRMRGVATRPVKQITKSEVRDLYYSMYYKKSGADKIKDPKLALRVFDTAVNMGPAAAKEILKACNNSITEFDRIRDNRYKAISERKKRQARENGKPEIDYYPGWKNRMNALRQHTLTNSFEALV